jgi:diguanylate cyclase (GGDEF)-like protein
MPFLTDRLGEDVLTKAEREMRRYRSRVARIAIFALLVLLGVLLTTEFALLRFMAREQIHPHLFNLASIAILAVICGVSLWLISKQATKTAGYLLACSIFAITGLAILLYPRNIYPASAGFLIGLTIFGVIVGGKITFIFATLAICLMIPSWLRASTAQLGANDLFNTPAGLMFLISQSGAYLGLAGVLQVFSDHIAEMVGVLQAQTERLEKMALTDPLTGLANRRHLIEQLNRELGRARRYKRPISLLFIDLDGFKAINDRHGHLFGDQVLKGIATTMRSVLRTSDMVARVGGDEFAVLLPETELNGADMVVAKLRRAVSGFCRSLGPAVGTISFSAGISHFRGPKDTVEDLIARADEAQYLAKSSGFGQTCIEAEEMAEQERQESQDTPSP